jgi:ribosome-associated protein
MTTAPSDLASVTPDVQAADLDTEAIALHIVASMVELKALDPIVIDVRTCGTYTDFIVVCTGRNDRHTVAIADDITESLHPLKIRPISLEGKQFGQWVLIDFGDVVVHVFNGPNRKLYDIEQLWADAPRLEVDIPEDLTAPASLYDGYEIE